MTKPDLTWVYWVVGFMVISNLGTILTIVMYAGRGLWWLSKLDAWVEGNTKDINAAHKKIREIDANRFRSQDHTPL